jgi:hypothetical protein
LIEVECLGGVGELGSIFLGFCWVGVLLEVVLGLIGVVGDWMLGGGEAVFLCEEKEWGCFGGEVVVGCAYSVQWVEVVVVWRGLVWGEHDGLNDEVAVCDKVDLFFLEQQYAKGSLMSRI